MCHVYILFWRNIKSFGHFKSGLFVLSKSSKSSLHILDINRTIYINICFANIFSHSVDHLFTFFMVSFEAPLVRYNLLLFLLIFLLKTYLKNRYLIQRIFYSISFIILALKFSFIFWVNVCIWYEVKVQLHFFKYRYSVVPATAVEKIIFPPFNYLGIPVKNQLTKIKSTFLNSQF